jgi:hypothetical protein
MSDTPRTDSQQQLNDIVGDKFVSVDFARRLERELSNMTDQRDAAMQALEWAKKSHERELAEARDQLDRLADAMKNMWPFIVEDDYPGCNTPEFDAAIEKYKSALAAMEGGQP